MCYAIRKLESEMFIKLLFLFLLSYGTFAERKVFFAYVVVETCNKIEPSGKTLCPFDYEFLKNDLCPNLEANYRKQALYGQFTEIKHRVFTETKDVFYSYVNLDDCSKTKLKRKLCPFDYEFLKNDLCSNLEDSYKKQVDYRDYLEQLTRDEDSIQKSTSEGIKK